MNLSKPMEYSFLESIPNKLLCRICRLPCCQAKSSKCCGHLYCGPCLDKMNYINCPACQIRAFIVEPEPAIDREILSLRVFCPNRIRGCEWSGELARVLDQDKGNPCNTILQFDNECNIKLYITQVETVTLPKIVHVTASTVV